MGSKLITIEKMRELGELSLSGKALPKTWKIDADKYLRIKAKALKMKKQMYLDCLENYEEAIKIKDTLYGYDKKI